MATDIVTTGTTAQSEVDAPCPDREQVLRIKKRMLAWNNPVEFVNNMYGCHPDGDGNDYFKEMFRR